jgi:general L-amino acid transport system ATP-binding protein
MSEIASQPSDASPGDRSQLSPASAVVLDGVQKWFGDFHVLRDISLQVAEGEKIVICGPSGSGK